MEILEFYRETLNGDGSGYVYGGKLDRSTAILVGNSELGLWCCRRRLAEGMVLNNLGVSWDVTPIAVSRPTSRCKCDIKAHIIMCRNCHLITI